MKNTKIVLALIEKGLRQADLREQAGFRSESRLSRIINGRDKPTHKEVESLARALGKSPFELGLSVGENEK